MKFSGFKDIIAFAVENEESAIKAYGDMSKKTQLPGLKEMLLELQEEEKKHKKLLQGLTRKKVESLAVKEVTDLKISDYLVEEPPSSEMTFQDLLIFAAKKEQKAVELYSTLKDSVDDLELKKLFGFLISQERSHKLKLEKEYDKHVLEED